MASIVFWLALYENSTKLGCRDSERAAKQTMQRGRLDSVLHDLVRASGLVTLHFRAECSECSQLLKRE
jgi:hypothetical protein